MPTDQNKSEYFPELNIPYLEELARNRLSAKFDGLPLEKITLYRYLGQYSYQLKVRNGYVLVFDIAASWQELDEVQLEKCRDLDLNTGWLSTVFDEDLFYYWGLNDSFKKAVYKEADSGTLRDWSFFLRLQPCKDRVPDRTGFYSRLSYEHSSPGLNGKTPKGITVDEPHVVLYPLVLETTEVPVKTKQNNFVLCGDHWQVRYNGIRRTVRNIECVRYIAHLLEKPGHSFYASELRTLVKGQPVSQKGNQTSDEGPAGFDDKIEESGLFRENSDYNILSEMAVEELSDEDEKTLKKTIQDAWQKLDDAKRYESDVSIREAEEEFQQVRRYLLNEYGWKLQYSPEGPKVKKHKKLINEMEKNRQTVGRQISNGISQIQKHFPVLSEHLERHIQKGRKCTYHPDSNAPEWRVTWNS